jgi:23S rRNA (cytosine1962-C5)-methyltransferase
MSLPEITIPINLRAKLLQGHPWIYRDHVGGGAGLRSGSWVQLRCGGLTAVGLWDAHSPIAVRLFSRKGQPNAEWFAERVWEAWEGREPLRASDTTAYRWVYGEGDGLPGLVADRYGDYAIIQTYADSLSAIVPQVSAAMRRCDPELRGILLRESGRDGQAADEQVELGAQQRAKTAGTKLMWGEAPPADLVVQEQGLYFRANLFEGQKTGLFLDQRENRRTVEQLAGGREVLNCFSYTGGFSLYALRGGAAHVVSADIGQGLDAAASQNLALNGLPAERHQFITEDCFALLDAYAKAERHFQMVILDPPSFARSKSSQQAALRAYTRLNALGLRCVEIGGLLVTSSCTSQVGPEAFRSLLADAAVQAGRRLQIIHEAGHPLDHPVPAGFPEGRYLKFIVARVLEQG